MKEEAQTGNIVGELEKLLGTEQEFLPGRAEELFMKWKKAKKESKKGKDLDPDLFVLVCNEKCKGDSLAQCCKILSTQPEHLPKTVSRFKKELEDIKKKSE